MLVDSYVKVILSIIAFALVLVVLNLWVAQIRAFVPIPPRRKIGFNPEVLM